MAILVFAGVLSVPSAVFAEATWYGALKGGLNVGGGSDAQLFDGGSRWGLKGSAEAGEGLTAVYQFEHKISMTDAGQPGGRLAYVGLTGGFGSLTMGQIWNAAYNHAGAITDQSYYFGNAGTAYRHGNALSYAYSAGAASFQLDLVSDGALDTGKAVDKTEFGVTIGLGEIGKVAIAHTNLRDGTVQKVTGSATSTSTSTSVAATSGYRVNTAATGATAVYVAVEKIEVTVAKNNSALHQTGDNAGMINTAETNTANVNTFLEAILRSEGTSNPMYNTGDSCEANNPNAANACIKVTVYRSITTTADGTVTPDGEGENSLNYAPGASTETFYATAEQDGEKADARIDTTTTTTLDLEKKSADAKPGHKATHVAVQFSIGGVSPYIGYSEKKMNGATAKSKTTHYGLSGSLGDTGMSYLLAGRSVKPAGGGKKTSPWLVNVSRSLGGGATVIFEHGNDDDGKSGQSRLGLHVNF